MALLTGMRAKIEIDGLSYDLIDLPAEAGDDLAQAGISIGYCWRTF
jgi:aconitate hydratase